MRTTVRLMVKSLRFELFAMTAAVILLGIAAIYITWRLGQVQIPRQCLYSNLPFGQPVDSGLDAACELARARFYELVNTAGQVMAFAVLVPALAGLLIGVPLVARELESGTVSLAWTLSRSRTSWYLRRAVPLALIVSAALVVPAVATFALEGAIQPDVSPFVSFNDATIRGPVLVARGLLTLGIGVLAGALIGRQLPAVIVGGLLAIGAMTIIPAGVHQYVETLTEWRTADGTTSGDMSIDTGFRDKASGAFIDNATAYSTAPALPDGGVDDEWVWTHYEPAALVVPGARYPQVTAVETAATAGLGIAALGLGGLVVSRRRPF